MSVERPILFSTPMVQAILEGRKTMTRRVVKNVPDDIKGTITWGYSAFTPKGYISLRTKFKTDTGHTYGEKFFKLPYGSKGDIIWVRETFQKFDVEWSGNLINVYKADYKNREWEEWTSDEESEDKFTWKPSIFMPKDACRLKLEIINIKVERLQDISPGDACDEGIEYWNIDKDAFEGGELQADFKNYTWKDDEKYEDYHFPTFASCIESYRTLWQKINGKQSWNENPFVWVIAFQKKQ